MNDNYKGMDPALAKGAMEKIVSKKSELDIESKNASSSLKDKVNNAFAGSQTSSMQSFIDRINAALENLYSYLDGKDSNFAQLLEEAIQSYEVSDENVSQSYNSSSVE